MPAKRQTHNPPAARYRVLNPRGIPAGVHILARRDGDEEILYFEGDLFDGPNPEPLVARGFLEVVTDG